MPGVEQGHLVLRKGVAMASSDRATVNLTGVGGHGAMPHHAVDPVVAASAIVMALQTVVSRNVEPLKSAVVTIGAIHAGQVSNVIPTSATLEINIRALDHNIRKMVKQRIGDIILSHAQSFGVKAEINYGSYFPPLVNSTTETDIAREVALSLFGSNSVTVQGPPLMASEDFSFMLEKVPGSYLIIGNGCEVDHCSCMVHNPDYDFNDDNIDIGASYWINLAELFLKLYWKREKKEILPSIDYVYVINHNIWDHNDTNQQPGYSPIVKSDCRTIILEKYVMKLLVVDDDQVVSSLLCEIILHHIFKVG